MKRKKRLLKINNIIILYNIITILKYLIIGKNILLYDFIIDFIVLNIMLYYMLKLYNTITILEED